MSETHTLPAIFVSVPELVLGLAIVFALGWYLGWRSRA